MIVPPGCRRAVVLRRQDHVDADTVLHAGDRIEEFQLQADVGLYAILGGDVRNAHQRRVADRLGDAVIDPAAQRTVEDDRLRASMPWCCLLRLCSGTPIHRPIFRRAEARLASAEQFRRHAQFSPDSRAEPSRDDPFAPGCTAISAVEYRPSRATRRSVVRRRQSRRHVAGSAARCTSFCFCGTRNRPGTPPTCPTGTAR